MMQMKKIQCGEYYFSAIFYLATDAWMILL